MDIDKYIWEHRLSYEKLGKKIGMTGQTIRVAAKKGKISFRAAKKLVMATNNEVGFEDILPDHYSCMVSEYLRKESEKNPSQ